MSPGLGIYVPLQFVNYTRVGSLSRGGPRRRRWMAQKPDVFTVFLGIQNSTTP